MSGALHEALPAGARAKGWESFWGMLIYGGHGATDRAPRDGTRARPFTVMGILAGGTGGRPGKDGLSATAFPSRVRCIPLEITEALAPIVFWRKELREDSGGPGRHRGGLGQTL